jgi:histidyl-tRNA synthetase
MNSKTILSSQPYKGTRDFYPEMLLKRNYIFETWRKVLIANGFVEYDTSIIENAEMYIIKSGEELGSKQLYSFTDKGERHIALRPEMTPTLARIVSAKFNELKMPLRWFSIPNCFRYERPQKGRLREFWQLNVDIIGKGAGAVDFEILHTLGQIFKEFGATKNMFKIMFNHRQVLDKWLVQYGLENNKTLIYAVLDDWFKLTIEENSLKLATELNADQIQNIVNLCAKAGQSWIDYLHIAESFEELNLILNTLPKIMPEVEYEFSPTIIRGLAYYTGLVIEGFNNSPINPRAMFGGGRYDDLLDLFGKSAPAVGVGVGDVTWDDFLTEWNLYPDFDNLNQKVGIMPFSNQDLEEIYIKIIPELVAKNQPYDIDYEYDRNPNKRYETLKKRGCSEVIKIGDKN